MRKIAIWISPLLVLSAFSLFIFEACSKSAAPKTKLVTYTYSIQTPVYQQKQNIIDSVNGDASEPIDSLGKIYVMGQYIFLNDVNKGIHVLDNSDPSHPVRVAFLRIPGNQDLVIKDNTLYADMFCDLLSIDISDIRHAKINSMLPNVFTEQGYDVDSTQMVVGYILRDTTVTTTETIFPGNPGGLPNPGIFFAANASVSAANKTGVSGSTAKMTLIGNYIYAIVERHTLGTIDITNETKPAEVSSFFAGYDLETIFPFKQSLFLGSDIGTFIYDISNPSNPVQSGEFKHGQACDPVITDGANAYITLHTGSTCGGASNELDIVNVQNLMQPFLVKSYPMTSPTGLCKDGKLLFICDGPETVRVYDATTASGIFQLSGITVKGPNDLIAANNNLMVITSAGLYQYNYSNPKNIYQISYFGIK